MKTIEEAKKHFLEGGYVAGMELQPNFVVSSKSDISTGKNTFLTTEIEDLLNENIHLKRYIARDIIESLYFIFLILPPYKGEGVDWKEKKVLKRNLKWLYLYISISNCEQFTTATKQEALSIMATEILRGVAKYLSNVKEFKYELFYADLERLFKEHQLI